MILNKYLTFLLGCFFIVLTSFANDPNPIGTSSNAPQTTQPATPIVWTKAKLIEQLSLIEAEELRQAERIKALVDSLRQKHTGYPVLGPEGDTIVTIWQKSGELTAEQRAKYITETIAALKADELLKPDSIRVDSSIASTDVMYNDKILVSFTEPDMMWYTESRTRLANDFREKAVAALTRSQEQAGLLTFLMRLGLVILVLGALFFALRFIFRM
jgi:hypothetical protein